MRSGATTKERHLIKDNKVVVTEYKQSYDIPGGKIEDNYNFSMYIIVDEQEKILNVNYSLEEIN